MDTILPKKKWSKKRIMMISGIAAVVLLIACSVYFSSGKSRLYVDAERITISEVTEGSFQENIPINGTVQPLTSIYLDALEGGRVEEKLVEDGTLLKKGQPILKLSNTDLLMTLMSQQSVVYNTLTQMQINRNASRQNTVGKLNQMADVESLFKEAERIYLLDKKLFGQKVIGSQEFKKAENDYYYYLEKRKLTTQILEQDSSSTKQQLAQDSKSYSASQEALNMMQKKVGDLIVRSPVDGQLTSLDAEIGQNKNKGERLGQIDLIGGFKIRADIDQHYISRIQPGLKGTFDFAGKDFILIVKKIYDQVKSGQFQVDMEFEAAAPQGIRRGQTLQVLLALSDERKALLVPKGGFYQQTGGSWIFKLTGDGTTAQKFPIQLGNQNTEYYEVLSGLQKGDKVVTSSYDNYGKFEELVIKK
ncbi:MAG: HlyD family efflux transporter periplasmic adaptor subunit [Chitinophagaceae bacterium]|nr:HlyD family efflux transporter periplasmic adaptor subunit [Chitinophagaceae bacterium]